MDRLEPKDAAKGCGIACGIAFVFFILYAVSCSDSDEKNESKPSISIAPEIKKDSIKLPIVVSVDMLKYLFNEFAKTSTFPYRIKKIKADSNGVINYMFSKHLGMIGYANRRYKIFGNIFSFYWSLVYC